MSGINQPICLASMTHLWEAKCAEDDWSGVSDWTKRKQRQNRLNQRAWRRREALKGRAHRDDSQDRTPSQRQGLNLSRNNELASNPIYHQHSSPAPGHSPEVLQHGTRLDAVWRPSIEHKSLIDNVSSNGQEHHPPIVPVYVASKTIRFDPKEYFPLPADHLLSLIRYNLYRAVAANSWSLGIDPRLLHCEIPSPFLSQGQELSEFCLSLPPGLQPTALQRSVPHHPYIDLFPFPQFRDSLILIEGSVDEVQLCADFAGEIPDSGFGEHTGLIVWGEPWDPQSWEIAEPLWKKWPSLLGGCSEALKITNFWRQERDEPQLVDIP